MTLVDTSVWIDHLRRGNGDLAALLAAGQVVCHPFIVGELACGSIRNRPEVLGLLQALDSIPLAEHDEVLSMVDERGLAGRGLGWIDMHLIASALLAGCTMFTFDRPLGSTAANLGITTVEK